MHSEEVPCHFLVGLIAAFPHLCVLASIRGAAPTVLLFPCSHFSWCVLVRLFVLPSARIRVSATERREDCK